MYRAFVGLTVTFIQLFAGFSHQYEISGRKTIKNFTCVVSKASYSKNMTCRWTLSPRFMDATKYKIELFWYTYDYSTSATACPVLSQTSCFWPHHLEETRDIDYDDSTMTVTVTLTQKHNQETIAHLKKELDLNKIFKPEPVQFLSTHVIDRNCIFANWSHQHLNNEWCRVRVSRKADSNKETKTEEGDSPQMKICNLSYYTEYDVVVDCKPLRRGYWSDAAKSSITTGKYYPSSAPNIPTGSYTLSELNEHGNYTVTVYWETLPESKWNGERPLYLITVKPLTCSSSTKFSQKTTELSSVTFDLSKDCSYNVSVWSKNEIGLSTSRATMIIKKLDELPAIPGNVVITDHNPSDKVNLSWTYPRKVISFTVFWCRSASVKCKGGIHSKHVIPNPLSSVQSTSLDLEGFPHTAYVYGVAANINHADSSGFSWTDCSGMPHHMLKAPLLGITRQPGSSLVTWYPAACNQIFLNMGYNFTYHLTICRTEKCTEGNVRQYTGYQQHTAVVRDAVPGKKVCVRMAVSHDNIKGVPGDLKCVFQSSSDSEETDLTLIITVACAVGLLLAIFVCVLCILRLRKKCSAEDMPIDIPPVEKKQMKFLSYKRCLHFDPWRDHPTIQQAIYSENRNPSQ